MGAGPERRRIEEATRAAHARAALRREKQLAIETSNVRALCVGPIASGSDMNVVLDAHRFEHLDLATGRCAFLKGPDGWAQSQAEPVPLGQKRHGVSGPFADLFFEPLYIVRGTRGTERENFLMDWMAKHVPAHFKKTNGGVHRGVFHGESFYELRVVADEEVTEEMLEQANLILWGNTQSNSAIARFGDECPVAFEGDRMHVADRTFRGADVGGAVCVPSPANPDRYAALMGGVSPLALCGITHLNLQLLPDYLVWNGSDVLDFGFLDNSWR